MSATNHPKILSKNTLQKPPVFPISTKKNTEFQILTEEKPFLSDSSQNNTETPTDFSETNFLSSGNYFSKKSINSSKYTEKHFLASQKEDIRSSAPFPFNLTSSKFSFFKSFYAPTSDSIPENSARADSALFLATPKQNVGQNPIDFQKLSLRIQSEKMQISSPEPQPAFNSSATGTQVTLVGHRVSNKPLLKETPAEDSEDILNVSPLQSAPTHHFVPEFSFQDDTKHLPSVDSSPEITDTFSLNAIPVPVLTSVISSEALGKTKDGEKTFSDKTFAEGNLPVEPQKTSYLLRFTELTSMPIHAHFGIKEPVHFGKIRPLKEHDALETSDFPEESAPLLENNIFPEESGPLLEINAFPEESGSFTGFTL
ncbi:MAG: hypothetical protein Q4C96_02880 [Planctomycetia bacterium]|nr:hypothetical protein [Planctomycetia bacterium]